MINKYKKIKNQKGFSGVDIVIAMALLVIFVPLITTLFVNIYMNWMTTKRNAMANAYATKIIEKAQEMYFDEVTQDFFDGYITVDDNINDGKLYIPAGYTVNITVGNSLINGEEQSVELVKTIDVSVSYNVGKNNENVTMQAVKTKEILITPNIPKLEENMKPILYEKTEQGVKIKETNKNDSKWYGYENKHWAYAKKGDDIYVWIPRFAVVDNDIIFLYSNTNKYVKDNKLSSEEHTAHIAFGNNKIGFWAKKTESGYSSVTNDENDAIVLLQVSKYGEK